MQNQLDIPEHLISRLSTVATLSIMAAGDFLKKSFGQDLKVQSKEGKHNLVTEYDHKVEEMIISSIKKAFPDHIFLGEESGESGSNPQAIKWIIDPIDGTVNFAHNVPVFAISIAATFHNETLCAVCLDPMRGELFSAEKGQGAYLNGKPLKVTSTDLLSNSFLATGFPYNSAENPLSCINHFTHFAKMGIPIRRLGSAVLDLAYLAAGRYDGFWEVSLNPWDFAAGKLLVEEAGGKITNFELETLKLEAPSPIIASNCLIHDQIYSTLKESM